MYYIITIYNNLHVFLPYLQSCIVLTSGRRPMSFRIGLSAFFYLAKLYQMIKFVFEPLYKRKSTTNLKNG